MKNKLYTITVGRLTADQKTKLLENGFFVNDLRSFDDGNGASIEPRVVVNYEGSIITNYQIDWPTDKKYIADAYQYLDNNDVSVIDEDDIEYETITNIVDEDDLIY